MRLRTGLFSGMLAVALVAVTIYLARQPSGNAEHDVGSVDPAATTTPHDLQSGTTHIYCTERIGTGVVVNTGPDCADKTDVGGSAATSVTIRHDGDALVITGADP